MEFEGSVLSCPAGRPEHPPLRIDLAKVLTAEGRQEEVSIVSAVKAPELLWYFNRVWRDLGDIINGLTTERRYAERAVEQRKAVIMLDIIPEMLAAKKLSSNEANREAVISQDIEYNDLLDRLQQIEAVIEHLKLKQSSFEKSFSSVKAYLRQSSNYMSNNPNSNLSSGSSKPTETQPPTRPGWGKPRY